MIRNFNADGFGSLYPRYKGGHPPKFTLGQRREIRRSPSPASRARPAVSTWSLSKLAEFLVAEGVVDDISHEGLRIMLREEGVSFQRQDLEGLQGPALRGQEGASRALVRDRRPRRGPGRRRPGGDLCADEFGPLNLQPRPGRHWAAVGGKGKSPDGRRGPGCARPTPAPPGSGTCSPPTSWARTSCTGISSRARPGPGPGILPVPALLYPPLPGSRHLRQLQPAPEHGQRRPGRDRATANNVEIAYTPTKHRGRTASRPSHGPALHALDGTDHASHKEQASMRGT